MNATALVEGRRYRVRYAPGLFVTTGKPKAIRTIVGTYQGSTTHEASGDRQLCFETRRERRWVWESLVTEMVEVLP